MSNYHCFYELLELDCIYQIKNKRRFIWMREGEEKRKTMSNVKIMHLFLLHGTSQLNRTCKGKYELHKIIVW